MSLRSPFLRTLRKRKCLDVASHRLFLSPLLHHHHVPFLGCRELCLTCLGCAPGVGRYMLVGVLVDVIRVISTTEKEGSPTT